MCARPARGYVHVTMSEHTPPAEQPVNPVRGHRLTARHRTVARSALPLAAALVAAALLAGCTTGATAASTAAPTAGSSSGRITVTDQRGRTIVLAGPATRIVTIPMPAASMVVALDGGTDHLVGMNSASATALVGGILGDFYPAAKTIASDVSGSDFIPNVESIVALHPDVVIQWGDRGDAYTAPLEQAGIPVVGLTYGTQDDLEQWVRIIGTVLGKKDRADQLIADFHQGLTDMKSLVAGAPDKPGILYLNQSSAGYKANGTGTYNDFAINLVGGRNVAAELKGTVTTSIEQILAWNPDIVLLSNFDTTMPQDLYDNPLWQDVAAVKNKRVYRMPLGGYRWDPPSQESALSWLWLAQVAHPDLKVGPIRPQIVSTYQFLYGKTPTAAQMDSILQTQGNAGSAGYGVFSG
jgi:iron complex transport system substrate-binding protein